MLPDRVNTHRPSFDSLGRVSTDVNKLGTFTNTYAGVTNRLTKLAYPGGASANYLYFPNSGDKRLQQIKNLNSSNNNNLISQQDYTCDAEGEILTWKKNYAGLAAPQRFDLGYDNADQLLTAPLKNASTNALIKQYTYGYDTASNRTSETVASTTTTSNPNNVNEITSQSGGTNRTLSYDLDGSITSDGGTRTFEWDGANRLVAINYTGFTTRSEFTYDGLSRVAKIVEKTGSTINSTRKFVWSGTEMVEFRDATDAVTQRNYKQGQYVGTTAYFYTRDHLGSIREMFTGGGTVVARYDHDPYGRSTTVLGATPTDFNFTGLYRHLKSNLDLATYRAYDPDLGRWINQDPIEELGGLNLYEYGINGPTRYVDPSGLRPLTDCEKRMLAPFIPKVDLDSADLRDGQVPWWLRRQYRGVTIYNRIYLRPGVYNPASPEGLALLGHELVHVGQYRRGLTPLGYLWESRTGYTRDGRYEGPAYDLGDEIFDRLSRKKCCP